MAQHRVIGPDDPKYPAIRRRLIVTWLKTILGYLVMVALIMGALHLFGPNYHFHPGWGLLWLVVPVVMWWYCAKISLYTMKCTPADPNNPDHKRLLAIVDRVFAKSGLKYKPPVYISDNPSPNAFATGPIHRRAVVAATKGLFECGMTDDEIEAVFAHELGHVRNYDVAINSFISVLSMFFFLIIDGGVQLVLGGLNLFRGLFGAKPYRLGQKKAGFFGTALNWVLYYAIFWLTSQVTKLVQLFVVRSRESAADATGALITGKPCDLSMALQKLVAYVESHRPKGRDEAMFRSMRTMMIVDPLYDAVDPAPKPTGIWATIKRWWQMTQLTHPEVPDRIKALETMNGSACPRLPK